MLELASDLLYGVAIVSLLLARGSPVSVCPRTLGFLSIDLILNELLLRSLLVCLGVVVVVDVVNGVLLETQVLGLPLSFRPWPKVWALLLL